MLPQSSHSNVNKHVYQKTKIGNTIPFSRRYHMFTASPWTFPRPIHRRAMDSDYRNTKLSTKGSEKMYFLLHAIVFRNNRPGKRDAHHRRESIGLNSIDMDSGGSVNPPMSSSLWIQISNMLRIWWFMDEQRDFLPFSQSRPLRLKRRQRIYWPLIGAEVI
jgi:hypothetical protein